MADNTARPRWHAFGYSDWRTWALNHTPLTAEGIDRASADRTLMRLPVLHDPVITEALREMGDGDA